MKFKDKLVEGLTSKVKEYQSNDRPIAKIDNMDYGHISLDTITKLPNHLKASISDPISKNPHRTDDLDLLKLLFKDELFEND